MTSVMPKYGHKLTRDPWESNTHTQSLIQLILITKKRVEPGDKWDVCEVRVTSRPLVFVFTILIDKVKIRGVFFGSRSHEKGMRPFERMNEPSP